MVVKGIFTHWKQSLPSRPMSHMLHSRYDPHDVVHNQRIDKVGKTVLEDRMKKASSIQRPQTTSSLLKRRIKSTSLIPTKVEKNKGMDGVIRDRKKFLLRGNGNITGFYKDPAGIVSSYQNSFKPVKVRNVVQRTAGNMYTSSIMVVTPDPGQYAKIGKKHSKMKSDVNAATKKLKRTESAVQKAMGRMMGYDGYHGIHPMSHNAGLRVDGLAYQTNPVGLPMHRSGAVNPHRHLQTSG